MNKLTLKFYQKDLEAIFQQEQKEHFLKEALFLIKGYILIVLSPSLIISTIQKNYVDLFICVLSIVVCLFYLFFISRFSQYYNFWISTLTIASCICFTGEIFLTNYFSIPKDDYYQYYFGASTIAVQSIILQMNFNFIYATLSLITSVIFYSITFWSFSLYLNKTIFWMIQIFAIYFLYVKQKIRREVFLLRIYEMEWANIVKKGLHSNIITVKYDPKNNDIKLDLITDEARKTLLIKDPDDFKAFSRKTKIFNNYQESQTSQDSNVKIEEQKNQRNEIGDTCEKKKIDKKMTLENKIISIIKQHMKNKNEEDDKTLIQRLRKESIYRQKQKTVDSKAFSQQFMQQDMQQDIVYGEYEKDEFTEKQMISVKTTVYQNQTEWFCCLVINQESNQQKLQILKEINKSLEVNFYRFCVYLANQDITISQSEYKINDDYQRQGFCDFNQDEIKSTISYALVVISPSLLISLIQKDYVDAFVCATSCIFCIVFLFIIKRFSQFYNFWISCINIASCLFFGVQIYLTDYFDIDKDAYHLYYVGAATMGAQSVVMHLNFNFVYAAISQIISIILVRREVFLLRSNEIEWANIVKKGLNSNIITVKYEQKNNCINLDLVTDQTKKQFDINDSNDFKKFSRNTHIYESFDQNQQNKNKNLKHAELKGQKEQLADKFEVNQNKKITLENKIISIIKDYIKKKSNKENKASSQKHLPKQMNKQFRMKKKSSFSQNTQQQSNELDLQQNILYGEYIQDEYSERKNISIKMTIYQNQAEWFCCLVLNEETNKQKLEILKEIAKSQEANFFRFCIYTGQKLQDISQNAQSIDIINANIYQCYNMMQNFMNFYNINKNQLNFKPEPSPLQKISLECLKSQIIQSFFNQLNEIKLSFQFINCDSQTEINTYSKYLNIILMNIVENSINLFQKSSTNSLSATPVQKQLEIQIEDTIQDIFVNSNNKLINLNNIHSYQSESQTKEEEDKINKQQVIDNDQPKSNKNNNQYPNEIKIKVELIPGENECSNIIKILIKDNSKGNNINQIISLLSEVGANNPFNSFSYQQHNFFEWKVNYFLIGKLGPFYNFYIRSNNHEQGFECHFYIFQDGEILNNQTKSNQFKNKTFQQYMEKSNQEYYNINNLEKANESLNKVSKDKLLINNQRTSLDQQCLKQFRNKNYVNNFNTKSPNNSPQNQSLTTSQIGFTNKLQNKYIDFKFKNKFNQNVEKL
ncbi:hypothetical protein ABPG74_017543 [Tetrahymena malaccensis]